MPGSATRRSSSARGSSSRSGSRSASPSGSARRASICARSRAVSARAIRRPSAGGTRHDDGRAPSTRAPADRPATCPCSSPRCWSTSPSAEGGRYIDGTFGAGGYTRAILERGGSVLAIDRDRSAVEAGSGAWRKQAGGRLKLVEGPLLRPRCACRGRQASRRPTASCSTSASPPCSSTQAERGFSFRLDGPLDMRMGSDGADAAAVVNRASVKELAAIIRVLRRGEEGRTHRPRHRAGARRGADRADRPARRHRGGGRRPGRRHRASIPRPAPSRRSASSSIASWRSWRRRLAAAEAVLREGGRLVVVAFHSLEDRIVKRFLQERSRAGARLAPCAARACPSRRPSSS